MIHSAYSATTLLDTTTACRTSASQAKTITGSSASKTTLKLVETIARWRIRCTGLQEPPAGVSAAVTAVNPAMTAAIEAMASRRASSIMGGMLQAAGATDSRIAVPLDVG